MVFAGRPELVGGRILSGKRGPGYSRLPPVPALLTSICTQIRRRTHFLLLLKSGHDPSPALLSHLTLEFPRNCKWRESFPPILRRQYSPKKSYFSPLIWGRDGGKSRKNPIIHTATENQHTPSTLRVCAFLSFAPPASNGSKRLT